MFQSVTEIGFEGTDVFSMGGAELEFIGSEPFSRIRSDFLKSESGKKLKWLTYLV